MNKKQHGALTFAVRDLYAKHDILSGGRENNS